MYQEFFQFETLPFKLTPNPNFFCELKGHQEALNTLEFCINSGEGFVKIIGEVGSGKSLLCRKLIDILDDRFVTAYIPNPDLSPIELRKAVANELGLEPTELHDQYELSNATYQHLIQLHSQGKKVVLLIDEAQALTDDGLETIRLLTNLEADNTKLLQVVLFGQPELDTKLNKPRLRQLKQRITFSYHLPLMNRDDLDTYLHHRLAVAGNKHGQIFSKRARNLLYKASNGVPRIVNVLSHKALLVAFGKGNRSINRSAVRSALDDTESANHGSWLLYFVIVSFIFLSLSITWVLIEQAGH